MTQVLGDRFAKVFSWYDNEWGFSNRMVELAQLVASASTLLRWRGDVSYPATRDMKSTRKKTPLCSRSEDPGSIGSQEVGLVHCAPVLRASRRQAARSSTMRFEKPHSFRTGEDLRESVSQYLRHRGVEDRRVGVADEVARDERYVGDSRGIPFMDLRRRPFIAAWIDSLLQASLFPSQSTMLTSAVGTRIRLTIELP